MTGGAKQAKLYLAVLAVVILAWGWPEHITKEVEHAQRVLYASYLSFVAFWAFITYKSYQKKPSEIRKHQERVENAVAQASETGVEGLTTEWYESASRVISTSMSIVIVAALVVLVREVVVAYPDATVTVWWKAIERFWLDIANRYSSDHKHLFIFGIWGAHQAAFWGTSLLYAIFDLTRPKWAVQFKVQQDVVLSWGQFAKAILVALFNHGMTLVLVYYIWDLYPLLAPNGFANTLPSFDYFVLHLLGCIPFAEVWFYCLHYFMHWSDFMWNHVHWIHHTWKAPIACSAVYAHPFEHLVVNFPTVLLGPFMQGSHFIVWVLWAIGSTVSTCISHSGWHLPILPSPEGHDYHHSEGHDNLGVLAVLDTLVGTVKHWNHSWQRKVEGTYASADYPVDKVIAIAHYHKKAFCAGEEEDYVREEDGSRNLHPKSAARRTGKSAEDSVMKPLIVKAAV